MKAPITALLGSTALAAGALAGIATTADAAGKASVTVTITAEGTDMSGQVKSTRPLKCANNRVVKIFKVIDGEPHLFLTDTTSKQGNKYVWSTGNSGQEGRFFAKVNAKPGCKPDVSPTITVTANP